jgi:hypothetical protein
MIIRPTDTGYEFRVDGELLACTVDDGDGMHSLVSVRDCMLTVDRFDGAVRAKEALHGLAVDMAAYLRSFDREVEALARIALPRSGKAVEGVWSIEDLGRVA